MEIIGHSYSPHYVVSREDANDKHAPKLAWVVASFGRYSNRVRDGYATKCAMEYVRHCYYYFDVKKICDDDSPPTKMHDFEAKPNNQQKDHDPTMGKKPRSPSHFTTYLPSI